MQPLVEAIQGMVNFCQPIAKLCAIGWQNALKLLPQPHSRPL